LSNASEIRVIASKYAGHHYVVCCRVCSRKAHTGRGCELYRNATQVVFGAGSAPANLMMVGEVPGDKEDQAGKPFVGPAGKLLDDAFRAAGIDRRKIYLTNAVKHFKWEPRGKRRLHARPKTREISACRPWLEAEIEVVRPRVIICLGAVAAQSLLGSAFRITRQRGEMIELKSGRSVISTWHPSAILRAPTDDDRRRMRDELYHDLQTAVEFLARQTARRRAGS
jgi:DNA polymerase